MLLASLYMSIASLINGVRTHSVPWWFVGYTLLVGHHLLRLYQVFPPPLPWTDVMIL
jgi:hypothetical protein